MNWQSQVSLASKTWWKIGGEAEFYFEPSSFDEFKTSYLEALKKSLAVTVLGGGTNVLVSDDGIQGLVISTAKLNQLKVFEEEGQLFLEAEAGVPKSDLVKEFLKRKLDPALFLCGLPGDVGGGVVMNASQYPPAMNVILEVVDALPGGLRARAVGHPEKDSGYELNHDRKGKGATPDVAPAGSSRDALEEGLAGKLCDAGTIVYPSEESSHQMAFFSSIPAAKFRKVTQTSPSPSRSSSTSSESSPRGLTQGSPLDPSRLKILS